MSQDKQDKKYHQAAFVYITNAALFFYIVIFRMPLHNFGRYVYPLFYTLGVVMVIIFPYLIYKGYRKFTMVLAGVYLIRTIASVVAVPIYTNILIATLVMQILTFYMLSRAVWDLIP